MTAEKTLTTREIVVIFAAATVAFLFINGPVWKNPFDIDGAVFSSYLIIPPLVAIALIRRKAWGLFGFLFGCFQIAALKYAATAIMAAVLWAITPPPPLPPRIPPSNAPMKRAGLVEPPPPTPIDPRTVGSIEGKVFGPNGPVRGAQVFVESGLDDLSFPVPQTPLTIQHDGHHFSPSPAVLRTYQSLVLSATDARLHTINAFTLEGQMAFNYPLLKEGLSEPKQVLRAWGVLELRCSVHRELESPGYLIVVSHPFHTETSTEGTFRLEGVPARALSIRAFHPEWGTYVHQVDLGPGDNAKLRLRLHLSPKND